MNLDNMNLAEWLQYNAALQKRKNALRKSLNEKGVLQKGGENKFDHYSYFSEAQYKQLFTELFSEHGLEMKFTEVEYETFEGSEKQANGRMPKIEFTLFDVETGFYETSIITGEGIDKGDKAGYKAYTGALKYYLANTFMVATGDDPEKDSPDNRMNKKGSGERKASPKQIAIIEKAYANDMAGLLAFYQIDKLEDLPMQQASEIIGNLRGGK